MLFGSARGSNELIVSRHSLDQIDSHDFHLFEFEVNQLMPYGWKEQIKNFALSNYSSRILIPTSITSREASVDLRIYVETVGGRKIRAGLPWLFDLYLGHFLDFAQRTTSERVITAIDDRYAVNLNIQRGTNWRYECHVDSNPIEGLLYVTTHRPGTGGELVVSNRIDALGTKEIEEDSIRIYAEAGKLIFFDARRHPHFVTPLKSPDDVRIVIAMNYYTPSCSESMRPADLNKHLGLE
jgi:hypothetical protein